MGIQPLKQTPIVPKMKHSLPQKHQKIRQPSKMLHILSVTQNIAFLEVSSWLQH